MAAPQLPVGLYQLVRVVDTQQNHKVVPKLQQRRVEYDRLVNDVIPGASSSLGSSIQFHQLDSQRMWLVGINGPKDVILQYFRDLYPEAFPCDLVCTGLETGLYVFLPWLVEDDVEEERLQGDVCDGGSIDAQCCGIVFPWVGPEVFQRASRGSPFCSIFRYMYELCSEVVMLFTPSALRCFNSQVPFSRQQRSSFRVYCLQDTTQQETDIKEQPATGLDVNLQQWADGTKAQWRLAGSSVQRIVQSPPGHRCVSDRLYVALDTFHQWLRDALAHHSIAIPQTFWSSLLRLRRTNKLDNIPEALLLQKAHPEAFHKLSEAHSQRSKDWDLACNPEEVQRLVADQWAQEKRDLEDRLRGYVATMFPELLWDDVSCQLRDVKQKIAELDGKGRCEACGEMCSLEGSRVPWYRECTAGRHVVCEVCVDEENEENGMEDGEESGDDGSEDGDGGADGGDGRGDNGGDSEDSGDGSGEGCDAMQDGAGVGVVCPVCRENCDKPFLRCAATSSVLVDLAAAVERKKSLKQDHGRRGRQMAAELPQFCASFTREAITEAASESVSEVQGRLEVEAATQVLHENARDLKQAMQDMSEEEIESWVGSQQAACKDLQAVVDAAVPRAGWRGLFNRQQSRQKQVDAILEEIHAAAAQLQSEQRSLMEFQKCYQDAAGQKIHEMCEKLEGIQESQRRAMETRLVKEAQAAANTRWQAVLDDVIRDTTERLKDGGPLRCQLHSVRYIDARVTYDGHASRQLPAKFCLDVNIERETPGDVTVQLYCVLPCAEGAGTSDGVTAWTLSRYSCVTMSPVSRMLMCRLVEGGRLMLTVVADGADGITQVHLRPKCTAVSLGEGQRYCKLLLKRSLACADWDEVGRFVLLVDTWDCTAMVYQFDSTYKQLQHKAVVRFGEEGVELQNVLLVPGKKELLVVDKMRRVYLYDFASRHYKPTSPLTLAEDVQQLLITPDGSMCTAMHSVAQQGSSWTMSVYLLEAAGDASPLTSIYDRTTLGLFQGLSPDTTFSMSLIDSTVHLLALDATHHVCRSSIIKITSHLSTNVLCHRATSQSKEEGTAEGTAGTVVNGMMDYMYFIFDKFPARTATGLVPTPTRVMVTCRMSDMEPGLQHEGSGADCPMSDIEHQAQSGAGQAALQRVVQYGKALQRNVERNTRKNFEGVDLVWAVGGLWVRPEGLQVERMYVEGLGEWIKRAICLVPIQICRCENNSLLPFNDGLPLHLDPEVSDVEQVANSIHFGLYDAVLRACKRPVWVVSSMGSQSTGKSFQLNHLAGSLFDVSGGRCTDGCWLTARETVIESDDGRRQEVLLVLVDCEGLGSWERTETEDMLMSLYSAAISSLTMFKTHFDFNRYTSQTLQRFNTAAPKVKAMCGRSAKKAYTGKFMFALKDTQHSAVGEIMREFHRKVESMVQDSDNFVSSMYSGGIVFADFPYPEDVAFHERLELVVQQVADPKLEHQFQSGVQFEALSRTLLAKICCKDWTPMDRNYIRGRVALLGGGLGNACCYGGLREGGEEGGQVSPLMDVDTQEEIPDSSLQFKVVEWMPNFASAQVVIHPLQPTDPGAPPHDPQRFTATIKLPDQGISLANPAPDSADVADIEVHLAHMRGVFHTLFHPPSTDKVQQKRWHESFASFLVAVVERRRQRTQEWLAVNMKYFLDDPEAQALFQRHNFAVNELQQAFTLCTHTCNSCNLACGMSRQHEGDHDCRTNHACDAHCQYCQREGMYDSTSSSSNQPIPVCKEAAGHAGLHNCGSAVHVCGRDCVLHNIAWNCKQRCSKDPGHDGECNCGSGNHLCGAKCDLKGCEERCVVPYGTDHPRHQCARRECPRACVLCNLTCAQGDHFHDLQPGAVHLCGRSHACTDLITKAPKLCSSQGVCEIRPELRRETRRFSGKRDEFEFEFRMQQAVKRLNCTKEIPPGQLQHTGPCCHSAAPDVLHYCGHMCPTCQYMCTLPIGHMGPHDTVHGNMVKAVFVSDQNDIDLGSHKYTRGESGIAESCDSFCVASGRGHVHVVECVPDRCQSGLVDGHRHAKVEYTDGTAAGARVGKDELTHEAYWKHVGFKDPCTREQAVEFALCGAQCGSNVHDGQLDEEGNPVAVYCKLPLWHALCAPNTRPAGQASGYVSLNGHFFPCSHSSGPGGCFHTTFIIDRSGSMGVRDVQPHSPAIRNNPGFSSHIDNRLGAVYEAMWTYIQVRSAVCQTDCVTFVAFDDSAVTVFAEEPITAHSMVHKMVAVGPGRGTNFTCGLNEAYGTLNNARSRSATGQLANGAKPIFILLTDSEDWHKAGTVAVVQSMMAAESGRGADALQLHCIGFGQGVDGGFMKTLADIGGGAFHNNPAADDVARMDLVSAFQLLAEKPDRKSSLMVKPAASHKRRRTNPKT